MSRTRFAIPFVVSRRCNRCTSGSIRSSSSTSAADAAVAFPPVVHHPIVELREYAVVPAAANEYLVRTTEAAPLRTSLLPLRFFCISETGGSLHTATHAYYYAGGHAERDTKRREAAQHDDWSEYVSSVLPCLVNQSSTIWIEAPLRGVANQHDSHQSNQQNRAYGLASPGLQSYPDCILEIRRYKLKLGYDTVPNFLKLYQAGLPSKLQAPGTDPTTALVSVLYSDVGRLNEVMEIWRHGNGSSAMECSRHAARQATEWKQAIAGMAELALEFTSSVHKPTSFSPLL
jgi:NIPSNAP